MAQIWWIVIMSFLVFALFSFAAVTCNGIFMSKTADWRVVADGLGVLMPKLDSLAGWIDDQGFFPIVRKTGFDPMPAYVAFSHVQEIE